MENEVQANGRVIISCCGWFHARHAAWAAYRAGMLDRYITTNPGYAKVPEEYILKIPLIQYLHTYGNRFMRVSFWDWNLVKKGIFDRIAQSYIKPRHKIFHAFSAFQERCWRRATECEMKKVIDFGSVHPKYRNRIIREEDEDLGMINQENIDRLERELSIADLVLFASEFAAQTFKDMSSITIESGINPYGVDLDYFRQTQKQDRKFRVIFVGRVEILKGALYLLDAWKQMRLRNAELVMIGGVRGRIAEQLPKYYSIFTHYQGVPYNQLYRYYSNASVFVFPSLLDGWGMVTLEAMACGLPVIVTTNTGASDIVRDGRDGFIVPIRDVEALQEKILFFYKNEDARVEMGRSAKEHVQRFTWDRYGNQLIQYYRSLKKRNGG